MDELPVFLWFPVLGSVLAGDCRAYSGGMSIEIVFSIFARYIIDNYINAARAKILQGAFNYLADAENPGRKPA